MSANLVAVGLTMAAVGFAGRAIARFGQPLVQLLGQRMLRLPSRLTVLSNIRYYKGGFDAKMDRREASLILGISPSSPSLRINQAYRNMMVVNHPDRGGSPYLAAKINEAKDVLAGRTRM